MSRRAAVIDIDGVLVRGSVAVPGAADALGTLCAHGVPHVFVTNGGGDKRAKARKLAAALATPALDEVYFHTRLVSCHDPMQTLLTDDDHILVLGHDEADAKAVIEEWGRAHNAFAWESLHATHSWLWPSHDAGAPVAELPRRVSAICMVATPHDWGQSLQLCCDLLRHNGWLLPEGRPGAPVRFYVSNPDFDYRARAPVVRMTSGAWVSCLRALLEVHCSLVWTFGCVAHVLAHSATTARSTPFTRANPTSPSTPWRCAPSRPSSRTSPWAPSWPSATTRCRIFAVPAASGLAPFSF